MLRNAAGLPFTGANFDGEGIALLGQDELLISSETEPSLRRFSLDGHLLGAPTVLQRFGVTPVGNAPANESFESLALSPSGRMLFTATEGPLELDGQTPEGRHRIRILRYRDRGDPGFEPAAQHLYLTEPGQGVGELPAPSDGELLVLERGFVAPQGNTIRLFRVSLVGAEDVSDEDSLAASWLQPLAKTLLVDLSDCPSGGARSRATQANPLLDNFEGVALGPALPEGRVVLLLSDDNFNPTQVARLVALLISR